MTLGGDGDRALICTVELDPPGVTLVADADRALGPAEFDVVLRCFVGGSSRIRSFNWGSTLTMELGSPVMTAPARSASATRATPGENVQINARSPSAPRARPPKARGRAPSRGRSAVRTIALDA